MTMNLLIEMLETKETKKLRPYLDKLTHLLFKQKAGWVVDKKRSKEAKYLGVVHQESTLTDDRGKHLMLTLDNSTDSGEFEINSLTPLMIEKGSQLDREIVKMYDEHGLKSTKKTNYITRDGKMVMREIHLGTDVNEVTVRFVGDVISALKSNKANKLSEGDRK